MDRYEHSQHEVNGRQYIAYTAYDDSAELPWDNDCQLDNVVSDWCYCRYGRPTKAPYERIINSDRGAYLAFDTRRYMAIAKEHGCTRQQAHEQCLAAFERCRRFVDDQWHYIGVIVECLDEEGEVIGEDSIWGIESDCKEYISETIRDLIEDIGYSLDREHKERSHWEKRGTITEGARA